MSYLPVGITEEQHREEMLTLRRREVDLGERRYADAKAGKFWKHLATLATIGIPLATFFGVKEYLKRRRKT